jgi:hypothetical protein
MTNKSTNRFSHLTNYSVSKKFTRKNPELGKFGVDSKFNMETNKWSFLLLEEYLTEAGIEFGPILKQCYSIIIKTIISIHAQNVDGIRGCVANKQSCYELFGFDILLDQNLKPWLMEVNISPSMKASCALDFNVKNKLAIDLFNCVGFKLKDIKMASKMKKGY